MRYTVATFLVVMGFLYTVLLLEVFVGFRGPHAYIAGSSCLGAEQRACPGASHGAPMNAAIGGRGWGNATGLRRRWHWFPEPVIPDLARVGGAAPGSCPGSYLPITVSGRTHNRVRSFLKGLVVSRRRGKTLSIPTCELETLFDVSLLRAAGYCFRCTPSSDAHATGSMPVFKLEVRWRPLLALLQPNPADEQRVQHVLQSQVGATGYTGVHLRAMEGTCDKGRVRAWTSKYGKKAVFAFPPERMCPGDVAWLLTELQRPLLPRTVFLAHDHQRPDHVEQLRRGLERGGLRVIVSRETATVDYWLLVRSSLFVGNPCSSFSSDVCGVRRVLGLGACSLGYVASDDVLGLSY